NVESLDIFRKKIVAFVPNSGMGRDAFNDPKLQADAWITWYDWALSNDFGEAVYIEKNLNISRPLNFALRNNPKQSTIDFTEFLKSSEAQTIFQKYGWFRK
ncbi:MAG: substrate-binding domain-containing protein, partial [Brevinema sp.]